MRRYQAASLTQELLEKARCSVKNQRWCRQAGRGLQQQAGRGLQQQAGRGLQPRP
jgi:hypothetical protein